MDEAITLRDALYAIGGCCGLWIVFSVVVWWMRTVVGHLRKEE